MKSIAEKSGVSISTVSLVLAGKGRISEAVRDKVLIAARELNYKSPLYIQKDSEVVAVLYAIDKEWQHTLEFVNPILRKLEHDLVMQGFVVVLIPIGFEESAQSIYKKTIAVNPRGVCSLHYADIDLMEQFESKKIPVVVINRSLLQDKFCTVCVDDFQGAYEGGRYLLQKIAGLSAVFFGYQKDNITGVIDDRLYGFQKALLEGGGCDVADSMYYVGAEIESDVISVLEKLRGIRKSPKAIFAYDDYLAAHVLSGLHVLDMKVPEDVVMLAPGDTLNYSLPFVPQITTMAIDTQMLGELSAKMILSRINGEGAKNQVLKVRQNLVVRQTT